MRENILHLAYKKTSAENGKSPLEFGMKLQPGCQDRAHHQQGDQGFINFSDHSWGTSKDAPACYTNYGLSSLFSVAFCELCNPY